MSDPITQEEIETLEDYFRQELQSLFKAVKEEQPHKLIGASGSFDTISAIRQHLNGIDNSVTGHNVEDQHSREIPLSEFRKIHRLIIRSTLAERRVMPGMEPVRVEMIVGSVIFINFVLRECQIRHLIHSDFALKEGVISELVGI
jgi:exopolyphosphatase/guanosine-5'-triphosphate,3'-diphosphate pyrophosphatase